MRAFGYPNSREDIADDEREGGRGPGLFRRPPRAGCAYLLYGSLYLLLLIAVAVPIFSVRLPPLYDYPNHLARIHILGHVGSSELLQRYYEAAWALLPNLGTEILLVPLSHVTDLLTAGRIGLLVIIAVLTGACSLLSYAYHRVFTGVSLASFLFVYNAVLLFGFIAYLLGVGLAIASFALWILLRERPLWERTILFCAVGVALFLVHLYAVGIFGLCTGAYELGLCLHSRKRAHSYRWSHFLPLAVCGVTTLCLLAASPTGERYAQVTWPHYLAPWHYLTRIATLSDTMPSPNLVTDGEQQAWFAAVAVLYLAGLLTGRLRIAYEAIAPLAVLAATHFFMPSSVFSSWGADLRLSLVLVLLFASSVSLERTGPYGAAIVVAAIVAMVSVRAEQFTVAWRRYDAVYDKYIEALSLLPAGARLTAAIGYVGDAEVMRRPSLNHLGTLVAAMKEGFYPTIFANRAQQPLRLRPAYAELRQRYSDPSFRNAQLSVSYLEKVRNPFAPELLARYDYILLTREDLFGLPAPRNLTNVYVGPDFRLARINHGSNVDGAAANR